MLPAQAAKLSWEDLAISLLLLGSVPKLHPVMDFANYMKQISATEAVLMSLQMMVEQSFFSEQIGRVAEEGR